MKPRNTTAKPRAARAPDESKPALADLADVPEPEPSDTPPAPAAATAPEADAPDLMKLLWGVWRAATDREGPTLNQLLNAGAVRRVDVDAVAGYVAVVTEEDTHRAIGVRREWVAPLVAALTGYTADEVNAQLAKGPAKISRKNPAGPA